MYKTQHITRQMLARARRPPTASAFCPPIDVLVIPSPSPRQQHRQHAKSLGASSTTGVLWQSFSTLTTATSQAAPAPAAVAGRQSADTSSVSGGGPRASTTYSARQSRDRQRCRPNGAVGQAGTHGGGCPGEDEQERPSPSGYRAGAEGDGEAVW